MNFNYKTCGIEKAGLFINNNILLAYREMWWEVFLIVVGEIISGSWIDWAKGSSERANKDFNHINKSRQTHIFQHIAKIIEFKAVKSFHGIYALKITDGIKPQTSQ